MSKKIIIIIVTIFVVLGLALGGGIVYVNQNIKPKQVKEIIIKQIESKLKGVKVNIKELEYDLGFKVDFEIEGLTLSEVKTNDRIASIEEAHLNVSVLSILFGGGNIDILLDGPYAKIYKTKKGQINWSAYSKNEALQKNESKDSKTSKSSSQKIEVPSIVENSKINFRLNNLKVDYIDGEKNTFIIEKIILKDLNLKSTTAYEIKSYIDYNLSKGQKISTHINIMGELSLQNLLSDKDFKAKSFITLKDTKLTDSEYQIPDIENEVSFSLDKDSNVDASVKTSADELLRFNFKLKMRKENVAIDIADSSIYLERIFKILNLGMVNSNGANLLISGSIQTNASFSTMKPDLKLKLSKAITVRNSKIKTMDINFMSSLVAKKFDAKITSKLLGGDAQIDMSTQIDLLSPPSDANSMSPIFTQVKISNLDISESLLSSSEIQNSGSAQDESQAKVKDKENQGIDLPTSTTKLILKNLKLGSTQIAGDGTIKTRNKTIESNDLKLSIDKSVTNLDFNLKMTRVMSAKFKLKTQSLNLKSLNPLLPTILKEVTGHVNASAQGDIILDESMRYNVDSSIEASDGSIKGLNLKSIVDSLLGSLKKYIPKKKLNITENYELLKVNSTATQNQIKVKNFNLIGKNKSIDLDLSGNVSMLDKKSELTGELEVRDFTSELIKNTGVKKIPLKLEGNGFILKPQSGYTTGKLVKKAASKQVDKAKDKLKDEIKKKAKDLFKGFKL